MGRKIKRKGRFWVYMAECQDGTYYTGYTNNLRRRLERHNKGFASKYTGVRLPVRLVWCKEYRQFKSAFKLEAIIKGLTRKQKETLVNGRRLDKVLAATKSL